MLNMFSDACPVGYAGQYFVLAFPENIGLGALTIYITSATSQSATVQVVAPLLASTVWPGTGVNVAPGTSQIVTIPVQFQLSGLGIEQKGIYVSASNNIVVFAKNRYLGSCGAFQVIPQNFLGTSYHAVVSWADSFTAKSFPFIAVVASASGTTTVTFNFPSGSGTAITYNGNRYTTSMQIQLSQWQTFQLQDTGLSDLTGTYIQSSQPVAVFSGNVDANVVNDNGDNKIPDHFVEQMIPVTAYGTVFYAVAFPGQSGNNLYLRIVCQYDSTTIYVNSAFFGSCNAHRSIDWLQTQTAFVVVQSSNPVSVTQLLDGAGPTAAYGTPSLVVVPAVTNYLSEYTFIVPTEIDQATIIVIAPNAIQSSITLNGNSLNSQWTQFPNTNTYGTRYLLGSPGAYTIRSANGAFGAYVYGRDTADVCSVAFAAGMNVGTANCVVRMLFNSLYRYGIIFN